VGPSSVSKKNPPQMKKARVKAQKVAYSHEEYEEYEEYE
jgi:hypothetical protein